MARAKGVVSNASPSTMTWAQGCATTRRYPGVVGTSSSRPFLPGSLPVVPERRAKSSMTTPPAPSKSEKQKSTAATVATLGPGRLTTGETMIGELAFTVRPRDDRASSTAERGSCPMSSSAASSAVASSFAVW